MRFCKIGIAKNPWSRVADLQVGCPYALKVVAAIEFARRREALAIERATHALLSQEQARGEWFGVTPRSAEKAIWHVLLYGHDDSGEVIEPTNY